MRLTRRLVAIGIAVLAVAAGCAVAAQPEEAPGSPVPDPAATAPAPAETTPAPSVPAAETIEPEPEEAGPIAPVALDVILDDDVAFIPLGAIEDAVNAGFSVEAGDRVLDFMAYELDGEVFVRASACPPCYSRSFELDGETLVCQSCATRFDAWTGNGIVGACVDYPKAGVAYDVGDGLVGMSVSDLVRAYDETLAPGAEPLVEEEAVVEEPQEEVDTRPACCR